ncbi:unnamed protein product, partial [marine sediment metagenome]
ATGLSNPRFSFDQNKIENYCNSCWTQISNFRQYQIPSRGKAEIRASVRLNEAIKLKSVRFIQEGVKAPEVFLSFQFYPFALGVLKISNDGTLIGFHHMGAELKFKLVIEAIALAYYRDLVVPGEVKYLEKPKSRIVYKRKTYVSQDRNYINLPRRKTVYQEYEDSRYTLDDWYDAQARAEWSVVGHTRRIGPHFEADLVKHEQANNAGVNLPPGCTWVIEHDRGEARLNLQNRDLSERTKFAPPKHAANELNNLIFK